MPQGRIIIGIDEAGRGPLAGPVVAAAVILPADYELPGLTDSKKLSAKARDHLFEKICTIARFAIAEATHQEIDHINILQATLLAMQRAVEKLGVQDAEAWVDGNQAPKLLIPVKTIIQGDATVPAISAASILAKVTRDRIMHAYDAEYPEYGFAKHKAYGTADHMAALKKFGPCPIHRLSFAPCRIQAEPV
jgi:ribonuclease HII